MVDVLLLCATVVMEGACFCVTAVAIEPPNGVEKDRRQHITVSAAAASL